MVHRVILKLGKHGTRVLKIDADNAGQVYTKLKSWQTRQVVSITPTEIGVIHANNHKQLKDNRISRFRPK